MLLVEKCVSEENQDVLEENQLLPLFDALSAQVRVEGILLHKPPHRQFLVQRCSHCFGRSCGGMDGSSGCFK